MSFDRREYPVIVLKWEHVAQANHRLMPVVRRGKAMLITAPDYRAAKEVAEYQIKRQWKLPKLTAPLELTARCYFPDNRRRDAVNLSKMICDSMSGIVYVDDSQIHRETWERVAVDKANPRVELTITEMP